jgi:hypothetical protein
MVGAELVERRPELAARREELALVLADRALGRRLLALGVLDPARDADVRGHYSANGSTPR